MSLDAILWARGQKVGRGPAKSVLIALADYASEHFVAFPSLDALIEWTEQNRKTVIANMKFLQEKGWITDTGERTGRTGQIPVYQINQSAGVEVKVGARRNRAVDKSKSTENGTVPFQASNSTENGREQYQKRTETGPNSVPVTVMNTNEQSGNGGARGTRLPDDWKLTKAQGEWALAEQPSWNADHVRRVADKFRDYWKGVPGQRGRKTDWPATWRNWVRDEKPLGGLAGAGAAGGDKAWHESASGIERKGAELGLTQQDGEMFPAFKARVFAAAGEGPWLYSDRAMRPTTSGPMSAAAHLGAGR